MLNRICFLAMAFVSLFFASTVMAGNLTSLELLGEKLYTDTNLSSEENQSCQTCHHPLAKFADPENRLDPEALPVSLGSDSISYGGRNAPTSAYAGFSPPLECGTDDTDVSKLFCSGGLFWDGRATGWENTDTGGIEVYGIPTGPTYDPLADQAKGPFQNGIEMALTPDELVEKVRTENYETLFMNAFGTGYEFWEKPAEEFYNDIAIAIAAYERSMVLNKFSSRFDEFVAEQARRRVDVSLIQLNGNGVAVDADGNAIKSRIFSLKEVDGLAIFNSPNDNDGARESDEGGNCAMCHPSGPIVTANTDRALFTDFTYDNIGVPVNEVAYTLYYGSPNSKDWGTDIGLYDTVTRLLGYPEGGAEAESTKGMFRVSTLRNIANTPPYTHNGLFSTLTAIVNFLNDREGYYSENSTNAEVTDTINDSDVGNLGLSDQQVSALVAFLQTLTDHDM